MPRGVPSKGPDGSARSDRRSGAVAAPDLFLVCSTSLRFTELDGPGIRRRRTGRGWCFLDPDGRVIGDPDERSRLLAIALPPAYRDAWYNPDPLGHVQATGIDARGRRQYRYHPAFRAAQEDRKFGSLPAFGAALPAIRARVSAELALPGATRDRVIAAVVRLLDMGRIRVGNRRYAQENRSFGATTLLPRHVEVTGDRVRLCFVGKGGRRQEMMLSDRALARAVRRAQDLPGQHLFTFRGEDGAWRPVSSHDVNGWLQDVAGPGITAKQFRTWWASVIGLQHSAEGLAPMLEAVSAMLGNTPAIARSSYIHPAVTAVARGADLPPPRPAGPRSLSLEERRLMGLLTRLSAAPVQGARRGSGSA